MLNLFSDLFFDYTLRTVALGAGILGIVSGTLGVFAMLRRQSLMGDAMSHAALPGIVIAFLLTRSKEPMILMIGAMLAGWLGTLVILKVTNDTRLKHDSALGLVLSVFFGLGLMLLTFTQRLPDARQAGLDKFLFGQAATLLARDVVTMAVLGGAAVLATFIFWKEFKLLSFDPGFAVSLGLPVRFLDILMMTLLVLAIVIGLQAVGVVLMSAMVVAPAAAARQWTDRLGRMVVLSALFGCFSGIIGSLISSQLTGLSTGPTIVLTVSLLVVVSLLFAPNRGLLPNWIRQKRNQRKYQLETVLLDLYALAAQHEDEVRPHAIGVLRAMNSVPASVQANLQVLQERGWVYQSSPGEWYLTTAGFSEAHRLLQDQESEHQTREANPLLEVGS
jgi:manganese/zinc/iron transport system permease protein